MKLIKLGSSLESKISSRHFVPGFLALPSLFKCGIFYSLKNLAFLYEMAKRFGCGIPSTSIINDN